MIRDGDASAPVRLRLRPGHDGPRPNERQADPRLRRWLQAGGLHGSAHVCGGDSVTGRRVHRVRRWLAEHATRRSPERDGQAALNAAACRASRRRATATTSRSRTTRSSSQGRRNAPPRASRTAGSAGGTRRAGAASRTRAAARSRCVPWSAQDAVAADGHDPDLGSCARRSARSSIPGRFGTRRPGRSKRPRTRAVTRRVTRIGRKRSSRVADLVARILDDRPTRDSNGMA